VSVALPIVIAPNPEAFFVLRKDVRCFETLLFTTLEITHFPIASTDSIPKGIFPAFLARDEAVIHRSSLISTPSEHLLAQ